MIIDPKIMDIEIYLRTFCEKFGCPKNYVPKRSMEKVFDRVCNEMELAMPYDTAARDIECDLVYYLLKSGDLDAIEAGVNLGDEMMEQYMNERDKETLMSRFLEAALALKHLLKRKEKEEDEAIRKNL